MIRALNSNQPFDQFTIEQIAGDLLPNPTPDQLTATAFHRNTLTNSEGGTDDEEFRNVAIVDRVNTTLQVWMGTTIRCAQCHDHKYDPISQEDYFRFFAYFNSTADADRRDESPLLTRMTERMEKEKSALLADIDKAKKSLVPSDAQLAQRVSTWKHLASRNYDWIPLAPRTAHASGGTTLTIQPDESVLASGKSPAKDSYIVDFETSMSGITAIQLEAISNPQQPKRGPGRSSGGNFVLSDLQVIDHSDSRMAPRGRYVRLDLPGNGKMIHVAEVQVFRDGKNIAPAGKATQSSTDFGGPPERAIDGNTEGDYQKNSVTHTAVSKDPWLEIDLGKVTEIDRIVVWNRTDNNLQARLNGVALSILDENRVQNWTTTYPDAAKRELAADLSAASPIPLASASADHEQQAGGKEPSGAWSANGSLTTTDQDVVANQLVIFEHAD